MRPDPASTGRRSRALTLAEFTARGKAFRFPKGESGNISGQSRFYHECRKLAREASPEMMAGLIDLAKNAEDERVRSVCLVAVLDRAGVRPMDYDPTKDAEKPKLPFDPRAYSTAELLQLDVALKLLMENRTVAAPEDRSRSQMQTASRSK
jgi:hypothetical protein